MALFRNFGLSDAPLNLGSSIDLDDTKEWSLTSIIVKCRVFVPMARRFFTSSLK